MLNDDYMARKQKGFVPKPRHLVPEVVDIKILPEVKEEELLPDAHTMHKKVGWQKATA